MTILDALENALELLEGLDHGEGNPTYDGLSQAVRLIIDKCPKLGATEL